jgi:ABC-type phosphonate transport system ATPase subunit
MSVIVPWFSDRNPMLEVAALSHFYGKHQALADIGLEVARGEIVAILGANGAGKSTPRPAPPRAEPDSMCISPRVCCAKRRR